MQILPFTEPNKSVKATTTLSAFKKSLKDLQYPVTYPEFFWVDWYTHQTQEGATFSQQVEKFSNSVPPDTLKMHSLALSVLRFLCKTYNLQIT